MSNHAPTVYGKYQLLERLARGGMAEVYKAKSYGVEGFEKVLVIKRILPSLSDNPDFVDMFVTEAKVTVTLTHANIVQVFDLGKAEDSYFIAMEYVQGMDLATLLRRGKKYGVPMPRELAVYLISEVAKGLDYAHRKRGADMQPLKIVHRDISPQNILISEEGEVKLTDFGIAKVASAVSENSDDSQGGVLKGKYAYMSPEHAAGMDVDARADIYSLGLVLYECLAGENPLRHRSSYETLKRARAATIPALVDEIPDASTELSDLLQRAMHPAIDRRLPNAGLLYEELIQYLYGTGRRVGASDLSDYLEKLKAASGRKRADTDQHLKAAFDEDPLRSRSLELTPAEVPSARPAERRRDSSGTGRRRATTGVARPQSERRDVTLLLIKPQHASDALRDLIRRNGGEVIDEEAGQLHALFGRVVPDGRDAEVAARTALTAMQAEPGTRAGIHSGRVLVDPSGALVRDASLTKLTMDATNAFESATAGTTVVSESTYPALKRNFELLDEAGEHRLVGERNLSEAMTRFIGRKQELRLVGETLARASKKRQSVVALIGDPGIGKSRLLTETMRRLRVGGHDVAMYMCRVPPQSHDIALATCQEMLRVVLGVDEFDTEIEVMEKAQRLRELGLQSGEIDAISRALGIASVDSGKGDQDLASAIGRVAAKLAEDRLTIFAFDDFDGVDPQSLQVLEWLASRNSQASIVLAVAHRGEGPKWEGARLVQRVHLTQMDEEDVARLVAAQLGADEVPSELLREVTVKSAGNPLYVEEYVRGLLESDAITHNPDGMIKFAPPEGSEVPKTLRGVVTQRLSHLEAPERHLLQIAAIVGGRFHDAMLARVADRDDAEVDASIQKLVARGIFRPTGPREFAVSHALIPEVIKSTLPLSARKELHGAVGHALEELYPTHLDDLAERLAFHHKESGNRDRAIDFLIRAADRLENEFAFAPSVTFLKRAVDLMAALPTPDRDRMLRIYLRIGQLALRGRMSDLGIENMDSALAISEGLGRDEYTARFALLRGQCLAYRGERHEAQQWLERAEQVARSVGHRELLRDITTAHAHALTGNGEYARAAKLLEEALEIARDANDRQAELRCLMPLAHARAGHGSAHSALSAISDARNLLTGLPERVADCELWKIESLVRYYSGELALSADASQRALELAKEYGFSYEASVNAHNLGETYVRLGDFKRAFAMLRYSHDLAREHGYTRLRYANLRVLGFIDATKLGSDEGRRHIAEALEFARESGAIWDVVQARHMLAIVDAKLGATDDARAGLRELLQLAVEYGMKHYERQAEEALLALDEERDVPMPR